MGKVMEAFAALHDLPYIYYGANTLKNCCGSVGETVYGEVVAFVVHGPSTFVASNRTPRDHVNTKPEPAPPPALERLNVGGPVTVDWS
jgi:hypothetical protein